MNNMDDLVPWWAALVSLIVGGVAVYFGMRGSGTIGLAAATAAVAPKIGFIGLLSDFFMYIPHTLLLFGVLADVFTLDGVYSIPSLIGLLSIPINYALKFMIDGLLAIISSTVGNVTALAATTPAVVTPLMGGATTTEYTGCALQGMERLQNPYAPQTLVITSTIFAYYMFDLLANRGPVEATTTIVFFATFFGLQTWAVRDCGDLTNNLVRGSLTALMEGLGIGGLSYATVQAFAPERLPSAVIPKRPKLESIKSKADSCAADFAKLQSTLASAATAAATNSAAAGGSTAGTGTGAASTCAPATTT